MEIEEEVPRASPASLPKTGNDFETFWSSGMPEGVLEFWSSGVLEFWSSGVLEFWKGVLKGIPGTIESK